MDDETEIAEVAEVIAEVAAEVVAENNAAAERAEAVNEALAEAVMEDHNRQRLEEIHREFETRHETMRAEFYPALERINQCEMTLAKTILEITALQAALTEATLLLSTLAPSNRQSEGAEGHETLIIENPAEVETPEASPPSEVKRPRVTRHLV